MISKVMLTMESRIHGDMYVRFGGRLAETYHRKVEKRCRPSLLKEIADFCGIKKNITTHAGRHTFGTTITLANNVPLQDVSVMLGHASTRMTQHYARVMNASLKNSMLNVKKQLAQ